MFIRLATLIALFLLTGFLSYSQSNRDTLLNKVDPQKFAAAIGKSADKLEDALVKKSMKVLDKMQKQETKIYKKLLSGKDSLQARAKLNELQGKYAVMKNNLKNPAIVNKAKQYLPHLDSVSTSLKFLDANGVRGKVKDALAKTNSLQDKFQQAEEIKKFIRERREELKQQLEGLGMMKQLKQINKDCYYYSEQLKEYREIFKDPKEIEKKGLELLAKTKPFQDFMKKNSVLASIFRIPDPNDLGYAASLAGLQTRVQVNNLIQQQLTGGSANAMAQFQQNMQANQSQIQALKNKIGSGGGSSDDDVPDFKPNGQKTKSFLQRLEYGTNFQTQSARNYFPVTSDLGLSLGFKPNDKSVIGVGASYKLGWGMGWKNIKVTQQGVGLRSYVDWKLKGSLWFSGGYEMNYCSLFNSVDQLRDYSSWQQSGLLGLSKVLPIKSKFFKKTKLVILWDFLSYQQIPRTQPILFRVGYNF